VTNICHRVFTHKTAAKINMEQNHANVALHVYRLICILCRCASGALWSQGGLLLTFLSLATIGVGIADVFFSYVTFCTKDDYATSCSPAGGSNYGDVLTFTWISAGIWGGILVRARACVFKICLTLIYRACCSAAW